MSELVEYSNIGGVAVITLNRPDVLNALSDSMVLELREAILRLDGDHRASVGVLCGAGRAFCSGADVRQRHSRSLEELHRLGGLEARGARLDELFFDLVNWKPMIAAVHGVAVGAGITLALECEHIVTSPDTRFRIVQISRGLDANRLWALLQQKGAGGLADELMMTDRFFSGAELIELGLATLAPTADAVLDAATTLARQIAGNPVGGIRSFVRLRRWRIQEAERWARFASERDSLYMSEDFHRRTAEFLTGSGDAEDQSHS